MAHQKKVYPVDSVVERAIDIVGTVAELTFKISSKIGEPVTRQRFQGWRDRAAFSIDVIIEVHDITRIPFRDLIIAARKSTAKRKKDV